MQFRPVIASISLTAATAAPARSQIIWLNEIYASHAGTDDREFVELVGPPGANLDGHLVLVVEGEGAGAGTLDRAFDLSMTSVPPDGFFVLGDVAVANVDLVVGNANTLENGTETVYLVQTANPGALLALVGQDVSTGPATTMIPALANVLDRVGLADADLLAGADRVYDGAPAIGPDGPFFPAGIYRGGDFPNGWCGASFLDFDVGANASQPRTPGEPNVACQPASLYFAGLEHTSLGQAGVHAAPGGLRVSNIGSSGQDGVVLDVGENAGFTVGAVALLGPPQPASRLQADMYGQLGGMSGQPLGSIAAQVVGMMPPVIELTPDFAPLGVASYTLTLLDGGVVVYSQSGFTGAACTLPLPGTAAVRCGDLLLDRVGVVIDLPAPVPVTVSGGPTVQADRLGLLGDVTAAHVTETIDLLATDLAGFTILDEAIGFSGVEHRAAGEARLGPLPGSLVVSNIGSSGKDGLACDADFEYAWVLDLQPVELWTTPGGELSVSGAGILGGLPGHSLGSATLRNELGSVYAYLDVAPLGATMVRLEGFLGGTLQGIATVRVPAGTPVAELQWGPGIAPRLDTVGLLASEPPGYVFAVDAPGVLLPEGTSDVIVFDEVRLRAVDATASVDVLSDVELAGTSLGAIEILGEGQGARFGGLQHRALGTARLRMTGGALELSNIGSSGQDGVRAELGDAESFAARLTLRQDPPPGSSLASRAMIALGGTGTVDWDALVHDFSGTPGAVLDGLTPDFSALGAATYTLELLDGGSAVFSQSGLTGQACTVPAQASWAERYEDTIELSLDAPVAVDVQGGPTVQADAIRFLPDGAVPPTEGFFDICYSIEITAPQPGQPVLSLSDESVGIYGRAHRSLGPVDLITDSGNDRLHVLNIGSSGLDGVTLDGAGATEGLELELEPWDLSPDGARLELASVHSSTLPGGELTSRAILVTQGSATTLETDFAALGAAAVRVVVLDGGGVVGTAVVPDGVVAAVSPMSGTLAIARAAALPPGTPGYAYDGLDRIIVTPAGGPSYEGDQVLIVAEAPAAVLAALTVLELRAAGAPLLTIYDERDLVRAPLGETYCGPAQPNSTGAPARIAAYGAGFAGEPVDFGLWDGPPSQFGYCIVSMTEGFFMPAGSSGFVCLGGNIGRYSSPAYIFQFDAAGIAHLIPAGGGGPVTLPTDPAPVNPPMPVLPGETWRFQGWYRDGAGSNLTEGLAIPFD